MSNAERHESGHLMLISPERVFYAGLLGRPRRRSSGGFSIYVAMQGELTITRDAGAPCVATMAVVPPYLPHSIVSDDPTIMCLVIEPETAAPGALAGLAVRLAAAEQSSAARIRRAYHALLQDGRRDGFTTEQFDTLFFGELLAPRRIDPRIAEIVARLNEFCGQPETAAACAAAVALSPSRFLHLFKEQTGISFRAFRAWKRARHLLHFVNEETNLAHLAQDIGYPDSTHFSHSIRRFFGLQPRAIFSGSRQLAIWRSDPHAAGGDLRQGRA